MSARACVCALLIAACSGSAVAERLRPVTGEPGEPAASQACPQVPDLAFSWLDREELIRQHGELPAACLKALVRECGQASEQALLGADQAITCSIRYEALLRHGFAGSFDALLAWWRAGR